MSMYGEPDLAELLPAYYCNFMARGRQQNHTSAIKGILSHLFAMAFAVSLCAGGFYYYQFIYIPIQKESLAAQQDYPSKLSEIKADTTTINNPAINPTLTINQNPLEEIENRMTYLKDELTSIHKWKSSINALVTKIQWEQDNKIYSKIEIALEEYEADGIGLMDYAASYAGGTIDQISKETIAHPTHRPLSLFKIVNVDVLSSPEEIIRPCVLPGSCFAFRGKQGAISVRLGKPIVVGSVTLSHGSRLLLSSEGMSSAPKDFEIFGFTDDTDDSPTFLGKFTYDWMGKQHQSFKIKKELSRNQLFELIELKVLTNYGKEDFTCVYRFRVHKRDLEESDKTTQTRGKKKSGCC